MHSNHSSNSMQEPLLGAKGIRKTENISMLKLQNNSNSKNNDESSKDCYKSNKEKEFFNKKYQSNLNCLQLKKTKNWKISITKFNLFNNYLMHRRKNLL